MNPPREIPASEPRGANRRLRERRANGFTLIEMLLVLALLVALAAIVWPALDRPLANQRLRRAADQVRAEWIRARTKAITSGEVVAFRFRPNDGAYRVEAKTDSAALSVAFGMAGQTSIDQVRPVAATLPDKVVFLVQEVGADSRAAMLANRDRANSIVEFDWSEPILFFPNGTATAARVVLGGENERCIGLELRALTGDGRVGPVFPLSEMNP